MTFGAFERASARLLLRRKAVRNALVLGGSISYAAILLLASGKGSYHNVDASFVHPPYGSVVSCEKSRLALSTAATKKNEECENVRTRQTPADIYFIQHKIIPKPKQMHVTLHPSETNPEGKGILVVGDVHGCFEELKLLHEQAVSQNGDTPFRCVILVGDLCMKGPDSAKVVRYVREQPCWLAVRGNHDNAVIETALGDEGRRSKKKYKWVMDGEGGRSSKSDRVTLSDNDVMWLSELPYTITIPASLLKADNESDRVIRDITVVHAGLVPGIGLEEQSIETMVTIREVEPIYPKDEPDRNSEPAYIYRGAKITRENVIRGDPVPWASVWKGPNEIIFGHDARRGLQLFDSQMACGLDTGAVYGKQLTGIILPERRLVQVDALKVHSPIG